MPAGNIHSGIIHHNAAVYNFKRQIQSSKLLPLQFQFISSKPAVTLYFLQIRKIKMAVNLRRIIAESQLQAVQVNNAPCGLNTARKLYRQGFAAKQSLCRNFNIALTAQACIFAVVFPNQV